MIKIISDGSPYGTSVLTKDGSRIEGITRIRWEIGVNGLAKATLDFSLVEVHVQAESEQEPEDELTLWLIEHYKAINIQGRKARREIEAGFKAIEARYAVRSFTSRSIREMAKTEAAFKRLDKIMHQAGTETGRFRRANT